MSSENIIGHVFNLNVTWLLTGQGSMFLTEHPPTHSPAKKSICEACGQPYNLESVLVAKQGEIEALKKQTALLEREVARFEEEKRDVGFNEDNKKECG